MRAFPLISIVSLAFVPQFALADLIPFLNSDSLISVTQSRSAIGNLGLVAQNAAGGLTTVDGTFGSLAAGALVTAQASAIASYGTFGVLSSNTVDVTGVPANVQVSAFAEFQDILTISFAPFTGDPGILYISYTVNGTIANSGVDNSFTQVSVQLGPATGSLNQFYNTTLNSSTSGTFAIPQEFTFIYGQPFAMNFDLSAQSGSAVALPGGDTYDYFSGSGSASDDFLDTVTLSGLTPLDPTGQTVVTGAQFSSESGTQYGLTGIVPEPSFIGLMVPLLLIAVYIHRRNRRLRLL